MWTYVDTKNSLPGAILYHALRLFCVLDPTFYEYGNGGPEISTNSFKITQQERKDRV